MDYALLTDEIIEERLQSLPGSLRGVLESSEAREKFASICKRHFIQSEERLLIAEQLVALTLLGFVRPEEIAQEFQNNAHVNYTAASEFVKDLDKEIFSPIKTELQKNYRPLTEWVLSLSAEQILKDTESPPKPPIVAPPPPLPSEILTTVGPPQKILPEMPTAKPGYVPPPPPAAGKSFESSFTGGAPQIEDLAAKKIRVVGGTHDIEEKEEPGDKPFIIHRETSLEPVVKDLPYMTPPKPAEQKIPRPDLVARGEKAPSQDPFPKKEAASPPPPKIQPKQSPSVEVARSKPAESLKTLDKPAISEEPKINRWPAQTPKGAFLPDSSLKVVHYDEDEAPLKPDIMDQSKTGTPATRPLIKPIPFPKILRDQTSGVATPPLLPDKDAHKKESGVRVDGNMVDLR